MNIQISLTVLSLCLSISTLATTNVPKKDTPDKSSRILGMSVTGNKESPRSLTIVPWRSPILNGNSSEIQSVWQPKLQLLDPDSYRRNIKLYLKQRNH